jgi:hypothetical protein
MDDDLADRRGARVPRRIELPRTTQARWIEKSIASLGGELVGRDAVRSIRIEGAPVDEEFVPRLLDPDGDHLVADVVVQGGEGLARHAGRHEGVVEREDRIDVGEGQLLSNREVSGIEKSPLVGESDLGPGGEAHRVEDERHQALAIEGTGQGPIGRDGITPGATEIADNAAQQPGRRPVERGIRAIDEGRLDAFDPPVSLGLVVRIGSLHVEHGGRRPRGPLSSCEDVRSGIRREEVLVVFGVLALVPRGLAMQSLVGDDEIDPLELFGHVDGVPHRGPTGGVIEHHYQIGVAPLAHRLELSLQHREGIEDVEPGQTRGRDDLTYRRIENGDDPDLE